MAARVMPLHALTDGDGEERPDQRRTALEAYFFHEFLTMVFHHVSESGMHERISDVVHAGEIEYNQIAAFPYAVHPQGQNAVAHVTIREEVTELCQHVDFVVHSAYRLSHLCHRWHH